MSGTYIGADPGSLSGAVVVLEGDAIADWVVWWRAKAGQPFHVVGAHLARCKMPCALDVVEDLAERALHRASVRGELVEGLAVEGLFIKRKASISPESIKVLAESCGGLMRALTRPTQLVPLRPLHTEWRSTMLRVRQGTNADAAEREAIRQAPMRWTWPNGVPKLPKVPLGALCEASMIAGWARTRVRPLTGREMLDRALGRL